MNRIAATILSVQALVILLAVPVAINVSDVGRGTAWLAGGGLAVLCVLAAGTVRRGRRGYVLGSLAQVAALATGVVVPAMLLLGGVFALMWFVLLRIGPQVESAKAARESGGVAGGGDTDGGDVDGAGADEAGADEVTGGPASRDRPAARDRPASRDRPAARDQAAAREATARDEASGLDG